MTPADIYLISEVKRIWGITSITRFKEDTKALVEMATRLDAEVKKYASLVHDMVNGPDPK